MSRSLAAIAALALLSFPLAGCGTAVTGGGDDGGAIARDGGAAHDGGAATDGGAAVDGGSSVDGGALDGGAHDGGAAADGGAHDGGSTNPDGGLTCTATSCPDANGTYGLCANCGVLGKYGPFNVTITQTQCSFSACVTLDGGAQCGQGCMGAGGEITLPLSVSGFNIQCSGTYNGSAHTGALTCPLGGLGTCNVTMGLGVSSCP